MPAVSASGQIRPLRRANAGLLAWREKIAAVPGSFPRRVLAHGQTVAGVHCFSKRRNRPLRAGRPCVWLVLERAISSSRIRDRVSVT